MDEQLKSYVDTEDGLARIRGNKAIYRKMLGMLLGSKEFGALEEALSLSDYGKAEQAAHAIKGMTGNLSMPLLFEQSTRLMMQLRQGAPEEQAVADYRDAWEKTRRCVLHVIAQLDAGAL